LWEIFTQRIIFDDNYSDGTVFATDICDNKVRPEHTESIPTQVQRIIDFCLQDDPDDRPSFEKIRPMLVSASLDYFIGFDPNGAKFWKEHFPDLLMIEWPKFVSTICKNFSHLGITSEHIMFNQSIPIHSKFATISLEQYQKFLLWFGLFEGPKYKTSTSDCCLAHMANVFSQEWFFGTREWTKLDPGHFAVRFSSGNSAPISVSPYVVGFMNGGQSCLVKIYFRKNMEGLETRELECQSDDLSIVTFVNKLKAKYPSIFVTPQQKPKYETAQIVVINPIKSETPLVQDYLS